MDAETLKRLALKTLTVKESARVLVDLDPVLADLATAVANPARRWTLRLTDWCNSMRLPTDTLDNLRIGLVKEINDANQRAERDRATDAYKRFARTLKGLGDGLEQQLKFGPDYACDWLRKTDLPALIAALPKLPTPSDLKAVS